jgi:NDP-sugar pyrophosphorylase family protein
VLSVTGQTKIRRMPVIALVMAGGRGERMRVSGATKPKPLVPVAGASLLERNLFLLLGAGFDDIVFSVPRRAPSLRAFIVTRLAPLVAASGGRTRILEEEMPLGNIGCAALVGDTLSETDALVVVYVDNLTTLDLGALVEQHQISGAPCTLAAHEQRFRRPYGELTVRAGRVVAYREKPEQDILVCSAVTVLAPEATTTLSHLIGRPPTRPAGLADLFQALDDAGQPVDAFLHDAPWVDVNDITAIPSAESLVVAAPVRCEQWWSANVRAAPARLGGAVGTVLIDDLDAEGQPVRYVVTGDAEGDALQYDAATAPVAARARAHLRRSPSTG